MNNQTMQRNRRSALMARHLGFKKATGLIVTAVSGSVLALCSGTACANDTVWDGESTVSWDWVQPGNWVGNAIPEVNNNSIIEFAGSSASFGGGCYDNLGWWNSYNQLLFDAGAGSFNIQGDSMVFAPNGTTPSMIENNSSSAQTLSNGDFTMQGGTQINAVNGDITFAGNVSIYIDNSALGSSIIFNGGGGHTVNMGDSLDNGSAAGQIVLQANDLVKLMVSNGYSGGTTVNAGIVEVQNNSALGSGPLLVNTGGLVSLQDTTTVSNSVTLNGGTIGWHYQTTAQAGAYSGGITLNSAGGSVLLVNYYGAGPVNGLITGPITGTGALTVTATGPGGTFSGGTLSLTGSNSYTGGTIVSGGTLSLGSSSAFPAGTSLNVSSGASVVIANHGTNTTSVIAASSLTNSGTIDITNNALIMQSGTLGAVTAQVAQAYAAGTWTGNSSTGGVITSSSAAGDSNHLTAVGTATNLNTFQGATVPTTDVLVKYTYYGDANLDGIVDGSDYSRIDNGYLSGLTGWQNGDFNYDNVVDGSDYTLIDNAFNSQGGSLEALIASPSAITSAQIAGAAVSAVPEPTTLGLVALLSIGTLRRRGRRLH